MGNTLKGMVRGDLPLARVIFKDPSRRRLIPDLQEDGWPIFEIAGKRCGIPDDLAAHARKVMRSGAARRGKAKRDRHRKAAASTASTTTAT
jgi:hypothetical protein